MCGAFHFIDSHSPNVPKSRQVKKLARSHAVRRGLENKRRQQQHSGHNFRVNSLQDRDANTTRSHTASEQHVSTSAHNHYRQSDRNCSNPNLSSITADNVSVKIQPLSFPCTAIAASTISKIPEASRPLRFRISVTEERVLESLSLVLNRGIDGSALSYAFMLTQIFATTRTIDRECLGYYNQALQSLRMELSRPEMVASEPLLGAILLLAGIEAHLRMPIQVQLHMNAIEHLLEMCQAQGISLTDGIKRAIFWQDLNSSVMTGSLRIVNHTTFAELHWKRDPFTPQAFVLPTGFQRMTHLLNEEFIDLLKDIHALQCVRETTDIGVEDVLSMAQIDNHQASIQSRLASSTLASPFLNCCRVAAYLCSTMLRCKIWRTSTIPSYLSLQLLRKVEAMVDHSVWHNHPSLRIWVLYIGGAFSPPGPIRSAYTSLIHADHAYRFTSLYSSWSELHAILKEFIWSERAFAPQVMDFCAEIGRI